MKLPKTLFIAAAALATSPFYGAAIQNPTDNLEGAQDYTVPVGEEWVINQNLGTTYNGRWLTALKDFTTYDAYFNFENPDEFGIIRLTGSGELEYQGWQEALNIHSSATDGGFYFGRVFHGGRRPTYISDPTSPGSADYVSFAGTLSLEGSVELRIAGYVNQFDINSVALSNSMVAGLGRVVLNDYARLSFQNSIPNIVQSGFDDIDTGPYDVRYRFNIIKNVESNGNLTEFRTGLDDTYRIVLHMDSIYDGSVDPLTGERKEGSIGYLRGKGHFIKTGGGDFNIKNDGDFTGSVILQGGVTTLSSIGGKALSSAYTVNLAGSDSLGGNIPLALYPEGAQPNPAREFAMIAPLGSGFLTPMVNAGRVTVSPSSMFPDNGDQVQWEIGTTVEYSLFRTILSIETDQTIHNFQTYFRLSKGPDEMYGPGGTVGAGMDTAVFLSHTDPTDVYGLRTIDSKLTIIQESGHDGLYRGLIIGSYDSVLEKRGSGVLALLSIDADPVYFPGTIDIQEGGIYADGSSLGSGWVKIHAGAFLGIIQNNSGTLMTRLLATHQGELLVTYRGQITNEDYSNVALYQVGDGQEAGVLQIWRAQPGFFGNITVEEGVTIYLSARENDPLAPNDAFANAQSVTLLQGEYAGGRATTLAFADTNQRLNNLSGDAKTRLALGRGTVTLRQTQSLIFDGTISGVGNLILVAVDGFTLSGANTYFGATVVRPLSDEAPTTLILGSRDGNTARNSSGLILYSGAQAVSLALDPVTKIALTDPETGDYLYQPQHFGMLFGEKGSSIVMGDAALTIGMDGNYLNSLTNELANSTNNSPDVQAAYFFNTMDPGEKIKMPATPTISDFTAGSSRYYLDKVLEYMTGEKVVLLDAEGKPVQETDNNGNPIYDQAGDPVYKYDPNAKPGRGLNNADSLSFSGQLIGSGSLIKVGDQRLIFNGQSPEYTGTVKVEDGIFRLDADSLPNASFVTVDIYRTPEVTRFAEVEYAVWEKEAEFTLGVPVGGEGVFSKIGQGTLVLQNYLTTGPIRAKEGTLVIPVLPNLSDIFLGDIDTLTVSPLEGTIAFDVKAGDSIVHTRSIRESYPGVAIGNVEKRGAGTLILRGDPEQNTLYALDDGLVVFDDAQPNSLDYSGLTTVVEGELIFDGKARNIDGSLRANFPGGVNGQANSYEVRGGAVLTLSLDESLPAARINGSISGSGTFQKDGTGVLEIGREEVDFTGKIIVQSGDLSLKTGYAFENSAVLDIRANARVLLNDNHQIFKGIVGETGAVLKIDAASIVLNTVDGSVQTYSGIISGSGEFYKNGGGTLILRGDNTGDFSGRFYVGKGGVLDVTTHALGDASEVAVRAGGTLRIYSDSATGADQFNSPISDIGVVEKTGAGTVYLAWDAYDPAFALGGQVNVKEGVVIVDSARNNNGLPLAIVEKNAKLQINLQVESLYYGGIELNGTYYEGQISGEGGVIIDGQGGDRTLFMQTVPRYTGITIVQNYGILNVAEIGELRGGIAFDSTSKLDFGDLPRTFYIIQSEKGSIQGTFIGNANLEISGEGLLQYLGTGMDGVEGNLDSYSGAVNIRGGKFQVGIGNKKAVDIGNGNTTDGVRIGSLYINVRDNDGVDSAIDYAGAITSQKGEGGNIIKTGAGDLSTARLGFLTTSSFDVNILGVDQGRLIINPAHIFNVKNIAAIDTGRLVWNATGESSSLEAGKLIGEQGTVFEKTSSDKLTLESQENFRGDFIVQAGEIQGNFTLGGNLTLNNNAVLSPSNDPVSQIGTATINGVFHQNMDATLKIEINGGQYDKLVYTGGAFIDGKIEVKSIGSPAERGSIYYFVEKATEAAPLAVIGDNAWLRNTDTDSNAYYVLVGPGVGAGTAYERFGNNGPALLVAQRELARVPNYFPHKGLERFLPVLDSFATKVVTRAELTPPEAPTPGATADEKALYNARLKLHEKTKAEYEIGAHLNTTPAGQLNSVVNNFSPLAFASLVSLPASVISSSTEQLHSRLEERRYDRNLFEYYTFQVYLSATSNFNDLGGNGTDDPVYKLRTNGGSVGADALFGENTVLGAAINYADGTATFHDAGGTAKMDAVYATAYASHIFGKWFYFDAGASVGVSSYNVKRETATGINKSKPDAFNTGAFFTIGTVLPLALTPRRQRLDLTPYASVEYNHYDIDAFSETGSSSNLALDSITHDSFRLRVGSGIAWFFEGIEWTCKINLDVAFATELMDSDSAISSQFLTAGGEKTRINSKALADKTVQISPSVTWSFNERVSVYASYRIEAGFDGEIYNSINIGFRTRF
ncbi:MAG: autotransporter domain-containing protein [Puniceicoccales bacterium]|jgi:uncharacterized protein with beta-barrel porin domain|nr:autotransporter domain-containing protein [Puniceicoccales bacterium]